MLTAITMSILASIEIPAIESKRLYCLFTISLGVAIFLDVMLCVLAWKVII